jgi:membrane protein
MLDTISTLSVGLLLGMGIAVADQATQKHAPPADCVRAAGGQGAARAPARNWKQLVGRTWREFNNDQIPTVAAGAAFYTLLAIFPGLSAFVSLYGLFADVEGARRQVLALHGFLPGGAIDVLSDQMIRLAGADHTGLGFTLLISLALSLWSANAGIRGLMAGLNVAYEREERRSFIALNLTSLAFTIGATLFAVFAVSALVAVPELFARLGFQDAERLDLIRWPILFLTILTFSALLYHYGPSPQERPWHWITPGGLLSAIGWMAMSLVFSTYVAHFGSYNRTYGSLGAVVGFMTWLWLSLMVVLLGGEFNCEADKQAGVGPVEAEL